jgi:hypothetical protein
MAVRLRLLLAVPVALALAACQARPASSEAPPAPALKPLSQVAGLAGPPPADDPATRRLYVRNFEGVVFGREHGVPHRTLFRWTEPVRLRTVGFLRRSERAHLDGLIPLLRELSGLEIELNGPGPHNFTVYLVPGAGLAGALAEETRADPRPPARPGESCFGVIRVEPATGAIVGAAAFIDRDLGSRTTVPCLTEEIAQGLGLPNDTDLVRHSVFNDRNAVDRLTFHDAMLIRALYDPRLRPGMAEDEAMALVPAILGELLAEAAAGRRP